MSEGETLARLLSQKKQEATKAERRLTRRRGGRREGGGRESSDPAARGRRWWRSSASPGSIGQTSGAAAPLRMGGILEEITFGGSPPARAPFKGGRDAVMTLLHAAFQRGDSTVLVRARRGERSAAPYLEVHACIVPHPPAGRRQFLLLSIRDPNYAIALVDRSESECIASQGFHLHIVCNGRQQRRGIGKRAATASKLPVVSRVGNEKVLPWTVSTSGAIRCFDTVSLSQKPSLHRHAPKPILLHLLMWDASASAVARVVEQHESPALAQPRVFVPRPPASNRAGGPTAPPQHSMSRHPSEEEAVTPPPPSLAPPSPADEVSSDAMIGRDISLCSCHGLMATTAIDDGCRYILRFHKR